MSSIPPVPRPMIGTVNERGDVMISREFLAWLRESREFQIAASNVGSAASAAGTAYTMTETTKVISAAVAINYGQPSSDNLAVDYCGASPAQMAATEYS